MEQYQEYMLEQLSKLLAIDSPTGFTEHAAEYLIKEYEEMGYQPIRTAKGGILVNLGGINDENAILTASHIDTLGAIVAEIKEDGRIKISPIGGVSANTLETENCRIHTRFSGIYEGTCQLVNASVHVNDKFSETLRTFQNIEIVLDEDVKTREAVRQLGIDNGDVVCFDTVTKITEKGYIKSRFLDDKLSASVLLGYAKYLKDTGKVPERNVYQYFTVYEEVGHGASASLPEGITEVIAVDMGCVGKQMKCTEKEVSICAKDTSGPYDYALTTKLIDAARQNQIPYAVDVYPFYSSDAAAALKSGYDVKHALIGPGVYASHGYERSHVDGMMHTFLLLQAYLN